MQNHLKYKHFNPAVCSVWDKGYRFGFNGKEIDKGDEGMGGGGSTYDYGFRIYNPSIGKFLSVDPLFQSYPWFTPYQFAGNGPILNIDVDGLENEPTQPNTSGNQNEESVKSEINNKVNEVDKQKSLQGNLDKEVNIHIGYSPVLRQVPNEGGNCNQDVVPSTLTSISVLTSSTSVDYGGDEALFHEVVTGTIPSINQVLEISKKSTYSLSDDKKTYTKTITTVTTKAVLNSLTNEYLLTQTTEIVTMVHSVSTTDINGNSEEGALFVSLNKINLIDNKIKIVVKDVSKMQLTSSFKNRLARSISYNKDILIQNKKNMTNKTATSLTEMMDGMMNRLMRIKH
jgi:RHS repeat-associated protein